jgi:hypothetical protein
MIVSFAPEEIRESFNGDAEFKICARFWTGTLEFGVGDSTYVLTLRDGSIASVEVLEGAELAEKDNEPGSRRVRIAAPHGDWANLVKTPAPPFFLDYYSASAHHEFTLGGDPESLWAYYPVIRRTTELFREIATVEEAS